MIKKSRVKSSLILLTFSVIFIVLYHFKANRTESDELDLTTKNIRKFEEEPIERNETIVRIFDLEKPLKPKKIYENINCRDSLSIYVKTKLCVHDPNEDSSVSQVILAYGIMEPHLICE